MTVMEPPQNLVGMRVIGSYLVGCYSMFPRAVAGCSHGISNCMLEQPGETLTAQVSLIPVAATRLSYNLSRSGLEASPPAYRCFH